MSGSMLRTVPRLIARGVRDLRLHPWSQFLTFVTVTLVVFLSGLMLMLLSTVDRNLSAARNETALQVYWKPDVGLESVRAQWAQLQHMPWLVRYSMYTPDQALNALNSRMGHAAAGVDLSFLKERNPLPPSALLHYDPQEADNTAWVKDTMAYLQSLPGVDKVLMNPLQTDLGYSWKLLSRKIMIPSLVLLSVALALVVGNTIRLSLVSRAAEIEILQLVGAKNWYIRLPLLAGGAVQGLLGGVLGLALAWLCYMYLKPLFHFPPLLSELVFIPLHEAVLLVLVPMCMGIAGGFLAVRTRISNPNPSGGV